MEIPRGRGERCADRYRDVNLAHVFSSLKLLSDLFLFQDEMLTELLAEMKALRAVVLAQNQRIELLERQLARIEDGDV